MRTFITSLKRNLNGPVLKKLKKINYKALKEVAYERYGEGTSPADEFDEYIYMKVFWILYLALYKNVHNRNYVKKYGDARYIP